MDDERETERSPGSAGGDGSEGRRLAGLPEDAPPEVAHAARGAGLDDDDEASVLRYLLGPTFRPRYSLTVQLDTPGGLKPLRLTIEAQDDQRMQEIDASNRTGDGPFAKINQAAFNAELVAEAVVAFEDPESGRSVKLDEAEFLGGIPSPSLAVAGRFRYQPGLLDGIAEEVRRISGYSPDRVGSAQRVLVAAAGNS